MKGIIMSGGMGSRLRPLTCNLPKPMVPIFNKPVVEYGVDLLKKYGVNDIGFTLFYLPDKIIDYFGDGSKFNFNAHYYIEDRPLGTGGSVKNSEDFLNTTIVVISGDALTDIDLNKAYEFHKKKGSKATIILKKEPIPLEYGIVVTDDDDRIIRFFEKPSWGEVFSDTVNTGIYILEPEVFDYYKKGENFDFSKDLFPRLLKDNVAMYGYVAKEYWSDIGDLDSYIKTHADILGDKTKHYLIGEEVKNNIWIGEGTIIEKGVKLNPPVYIGNNSLIKEGAIIDAYTVIGNNTTVGEKTSIKRSIIWDNVNISRDCEIRKSVICNNVYIGERTRTFEGAVIGAYSKVFKGSTINENIMVWPYKKINEKVEVTRNLIWGNDMSKRLFSHRNISGIFNENITPELGVRLGMAFSSVINDKGSYLVSSDGYNFSKSIKNALISGILSTGAGVVNIKDSTIPMCRFGIRKFKLDGGIHIRGDEFYEDMIYIEFFTKSGANIDKNISKKIEKAVSSEDFKRCICREVEDIVNIDNFSTIYLKAGRMLLKNINNIKKQKPKVILCSASLTISTLAEKYLKSLGCEVEIVKKPKNFKIEDIQKLVLEKSAYLGFLFTEDSEKVNLTDGHVVVNKEKYYILSLLIGLKREELKEVVVPYHYPRIVEQLVEKAKRNTVYSKSNICNIIQTLIDEEKKFQYILNFDGIWGIGIILDYLMEKNTTLSHILKELPEYFYMKKEIACKWTDKGNIIRRLSEDKKYNIELIEGVKFIDDRGWVLIIPDEEKPVLNIYIEGYSRIFLEELWQEYNEKLKGMMRNLSNNL
jgi:mannose-1-phosphate guanylyltransferase/phosphomannomutase